MELNNYDNSILLKFGKKEHLRSLSEGYMYFSPLQYFIDYEEKDLDVVGRGDAQEGGYKVLDVKNIKIFTEDGIQVELPNEMKNGIINFNIRIPELYFKPIFCMTIIENVNDINETLYESFVENFDDIDSVLVIRNVPRFLKNMKSSLNFECFYSRVFYEDKQTVQFNQFIDGEGERLIDGVKYSVTTNNVHRIAFRKNELFSYQKEFRIILHDHDIKEPKTYKIKTIDDCEIISLKKYKK